MSQYGFSEVRLKAILDMKLSKLAKLEKVEIENEKAELEVELARLNAILANPVPEMINGFNALKAYGDARQSPLLRLLPQGRKRN